LKHGPANLGLAARGPVAGSAFAAALRDFVFLGFDLRVRGNDWCSVDATVWPQSDAYQALASYENASQLLGCAPGVIERYADQQNVPVAISVAPEGFKLMEAVYGADFIDRTQSPMFLLDRGWVFNGFDVGDVNGYFSIFGIDAGAPKLPLPNCLFQSAKDAAAVIAPACSLYPSHSPFAIFSIMTYNLSPPAS
jgi:hypothetical protein